VKNRFQSLPFKFNLQRYTAVALELNSHWMQNVDLFDGCPENLLIEVGAVQVVYMFYP
jgi:hypothetical protein